MAIKTKPVLSNFGEGETPIYRLAVQGANAVSSTAFMSKLAEKIKVGSSQLSAYADAFCAVLLEELLQNKAVDGGFFYARLNVKGSISSLGEPLTKEKNPVVISIWFKGELAEKVKEIEVELDANSVAAVLYEIMQDNASGLNRIENATDTIVINGSYIALDAAQTDTGVWLLDASSGAIVKQARIINSDVNTIRCVFDELPTTGQYRLMVATRNAENADDYIVTRLYRLVQVVNG